MCTRPINEPGCIQRKEFFHFSLQKCAVFQYFAFLNRWVSLNRIPVMAQILAPILGVHFLWGAYFPQKWDLLPPFQPRIKLLG
jgi:hypothetical protein